MAALPTEHLVGITFGRLEDLTLSLVNSTTPRQPGHRPPRTHPYFESG